MGTEAIFHKHFRKEFAKLPAKVRRQFDERFLLFLENPQNPLLNLHELSGALAGQFSINIAGDCRAIFYYRTQNEIVFLHIGSHSQLYG